ncbi:MAG: hypothetical protein M1816_001817 [Peltula sp. TS41687]|nr:MAG: hypothetical protein M1816_001817 [Peltula sp. TS41687]
MDKVPDMEELSMATTLQPGAVITTVLIRNLHCNSCVSNIKHALGLLKPRPTSISTSIVSQSVAIQHEPSLPVLDIAKAMEEAGFDIDSIFQDPPSHTAPTDHSVDQDKVESRRKRLTRWRWSGRYSKDEQERKRRRHIERCDMCRADKIKEVDSVRESPILAESEKVPRTEFRRPELRSTDELSTEKSFVAIDSASSSPRLLRASLSVVGMTCSSCVARITETLRSKPWIRSVEVNLLTSSASVTFEGQENLKDLTDAIEEVGYEAMIEEWEEIQSPEQKTGSGTKKDTWRAFYAVGGMTCSSCVGNVTRGLENLEFVKTVDVNLLSNSATVVFEGRGHLDQITEAIEDVGYEAKLDRVEDLDQNQQQGPQRTIAIRVGGMYCNHCPLRIQEALKTHMNRLEIEKSLSRADPIIKVKYLPDAPEFTIRHILASISATDPAFQVSIYHPPTLEERSRLMHARQRRHILLRVALSVAIAILTFIIGIVLMSLIPSTNDIREYLMHPMWSGRASRAEWALFIMATPIYFFAADLFHRRALKEVWALWRPGSKTPILRRLYRFGSMDMLMSLGTTIAYFSSIAELAINATQRSDTAMKAISTYFDSVVFLTMFLLIGRLLEAYSKSKAGDAVTKLGKLRPTEAILVTQVGSARGTQQVNVDLLEIGDLVRVLHGGSPPSDGIVVEGQSKFDESSLTGESRLVEKSGGDEVYSGTINKGGPISVRITVVSGGSMLDDIVKAVREGQTRRAPIERVADVLTSHFVPLVTLLAISVWIIWLALGFSGALPRDYLDVDAGGWLLWSLQFAIAVFVIACPCGIGLAAPTALFVGGGMAAKHGILVKGGGEAFQEASGLDCIVFDKTGTLTMGGEPAVTDFELFKRDDENLILTAIRKLEESSSHPIAKALVAFCNTRKACEIEIQFTTIEEVPGKGMRGSYAIQTPQTSQDSMSMGQVLVGNESLMLQYGIETSESISTTLDTWKVQGKSVALMAIRTTGLQMPETWRLAAIFAISDPLRPEAPTVIRSLQDKGIDVWMISGDHPMTAYAVGDMVGIPRTNIIAGVLPDQKAEKIQYLQRSLSKSEGRSLFGRKREYSHRRATIAMVGDGINDSPALTVADVGIAIGSGSDIAISSAEFVLISSSLTSLLTLIDLSRKVFSRIKLNFAWALVYNLVALPIAAGVLYPIKSNGSHIRLDPVWASLAMALSSVSVVCSSLLLRSKLPYVGFRARKSVSV